MDKITGITPHKANIGEDGQGTIQAANGTLTTDNGFVDQKS